MHASARNCAVHEREGEEKNNALLSCLFAAPPPISNQQDQVTMCRVASNAYICSRPNTMSLGD
jgi:hypothetical protein